MASEDDVTVIVAVDGSDFSHEALKCKKYFLVLWTVHIWKSLALKL